MITVIGSGNGGISMACYLEKRGYKTTLWNRSSERLEEIIKNDNKIIVNDNILKCERSIRISTVTTDLQLAMQDSKYIIIITPGLAHKDIAKQLAKYLTKDNIVILMPGRTFSCIEFMEELGDNLDNVPTCIETQTILHACRSNGNKLELYGKKASVAYSSYIQLNYSIIEEIKDILPDFHYVNNYFDVTLNNIGALLHPIPTILNSARIEASVDFKYYAEGITPTIAGYISKVDLEREQVCKKIGCNYISAIEWLKKEYGANGENLFECISSVEAYKNIAAPKTLKHRYIYDDINTGLVPLYSTGKMLGLEMNATKAFIDFASIFTDYDFLKNGRKAKKEMF